MAADIKFAGQVANLHMERRVNHMSFGEVVILVNFTCISERTYQLPAD